MRFVEHFVVVNGNRSFSMMKYPTIIQQYLHFRIEEKRNTWKGQIHYIEADTFDIHNIHWFFFTCFDGSQSAKNAKKQNLCNDLKTLNKLGFIYKTTTYLQRSDILKLKCVSTCKMVHVQCSIVPLFKWIEVHYSNRNEKNEREKIKRAQRTKINKSQLKEVVNPLNRLKMALPFALLFHSEQSTEHWTHSEFGKWCVIWYQYIFQQYFMFAIRCIPNNIPKWNALFLLNLF